MTKLIFTLSWIPSKWLLPVILSRYLFVPPSQTVTMGFLLALVSCLSLERWPEALASCWLVAGQRP